MLYKTRLDGAQSRAGSNKEVDPISIPFSCVVYRISRPSPNTRDISQTELLPLFKLLRMNFETVVLTVPHHRTPPRQPSQPLFTAQWRPHPL